MGGELTSTSLGKQASSADGKPRAFLNRSTWIGGGEVTAKAQDARRGSGVLARVGHTRLAGHNASLIMSSALMSSSAISTHQNRAHVS